MFLHCRGNFEQFEEMYEQRRTEVNKAAEKYEKQIKAAKRSGNKANQVWQSCTLSFLAVFNDRGCDKQLPREQAGSRCVADEMIMDAVNALALCCLLRVKTQPVSRLHQLS